MLLPAITWQSVFMDVLISFLLCDLMMLATFWVQQYFTFTVLLLNILWSLLEGGKWWRNSWRNLFPTFVETALLKGGLNQMMLRCRFLFVWLLLVLLNFSLKSVYPLSLRAFSYGYLDEFKTSSLEEFLDKRSLITFGNWWMVWRFVNI